MRDQEQHCHKDHAQAVCGRRYSDSWKHVEKEGRSNGEGAAFVAEPSRPGAEKGRMTRVSSAAENQSGTKFIATPLMQ
jgi:hypothetical protein